MNNREYANTLSDTEFVKWGRKFFGTDWDSASVVMNDEEIATASVKILKQPHETTGHEDLVSAGWMLAHESSNAVRYFQNKTGRVLVITRNETEYDTGGSSWNDKDIDIARKCADKIRNEKGWA